MSPGGHRESGEAYAAGTAREGASVVVADVDERGGSSVASGIVSAGGKALFVRTDVSRPPDVEHLVAETVKRFGGLDILVNNDTPVHGTGPRHHRGDVDKVLAVNVKGLFFCASAAAREMMKRKGGKIINISSIAAVGGQAGLCAYSSTKGAVLPLDPRVRAGAGSAQYPGQRHPARDDRHGYGQGGHGGSELVRQVMEGIPMKRLGRTQDLLGALLYFASEDSDYCTGQTLIVDGGFSMV